MHLPVSIRRALLAAPVVAALAAAVAQADTTRYTEPGATLTSGTCSSDAPCRIDYAINGAADGDTVVVRPGTYGPITVPLDARAIDLHGEAGSPPPLLVGDTNLPDDLLKLRDGGSVRHLALRADSSPFVALQIEGGVAEDLTITAVSGDGAKIFTSGARTTVFRDSVVVTEGGGSSGDALLLIEGSGGNPSLAVRNVTAISETDRAARCQVGSGHVATLVNVIARGATGDVDATGGAGCTASHSNLRLTHSPSLTTGAGIQSADPKLGADLRPLSGAPTIDAGIADAHTSAADPDGRARTVPDIGAYEAGSSGGGPAITPTPTPTPSGTPEPTVTPVPTVEPPVRGIPAPVLGRTVVVVPGRGRVRVRRPGARRFRAFARAALLPTGTVVDARRGRIRLHTALKEASRFQTGRFRGSRFQIRQSAAGDGMTTLALRGGDFGRCPARASGGALARTSAVPRENSTRRRVVRRLWSRDRGGRFRTHGNNSVATARGTAWVTTDRCDGTVTRVLEGAVAVRNRRTGRTVLVRAGEAHLARP